MNKHVCVYVNHGELERELATRGGSCLAVPLHGTDDGGAVTVTQSSEWLRCPFLMRHTILCQVPLHGADAAAEPPASMTAKVMYNFNVMQCNALQRHITANMRRASIRLHHDVSHEVVTPPHTSQLRLAVIAARCAVGQARGGGQALGEGWCLAGDAAQRPEETRRTPRAAHADTNVTPHDFPPPVESCGATTCAISTGNTCATS